ncbi:MAG: hypothetical protein ACREA3_04355 [Nitrosotalea sp.]
MIVRNRADTFSVTPLGYVLRLQLPSFALLSRHTQYFNSHAATNFQKSLPRQLDIFYIFGSNTVVSKKRNVVLTKTGWGISYQKAR